MSGALRHLIQLLRCDNKGTGDCCSNSHSCWFAARATTWMDAMDGARTFPAHGVLTKACTSVIRDSQREGLTVYGIVP